MTSMMTRTLAGNLLSPGQILKFAGAKTFLVVQDTEIAWPGHDTPEEAAEWIVANRRGMGVLAKDGEDLRTLTQDEWDRLNQAVFVVPA